MWRSYDVSEQSMDTSLHLPDFRFGLFLYVLFFVFTTINDSLTGERNIFASERTQAAGLRNGDDKGTNCASLVKIEENAGTPLNSLYWKPV